MVLYLLRRLVTSFYPERVKIYTLKNTIEIPFLGTCSNEKCFYTLGVPISRPLLCYKLIFKSLFYQYSKTLKKCKSSSQNLDKVTLLQKFAVLL